MKLILIIFTLFIIGCQTKTDRLFDNLEDVRKGDSLQVVIFKMKMPPDKIIDNDSLLLHGRFIRNLRTYVYSTEIGASSDVRIYFDSDTVFHIYSD